MLLIILFVYLIKDHRLHQL